MAIVKTDTERLYKDVKKDFSTLSGVKEFGVKKFSVEYVLAKVANKYYKSPKTIENIVFNRIKI